MAVEARPGESLETTAPEGSVAEWDHAQIGRYEFRRVVGSGGMGVVVAAHDPELDREVAIKLVVSSEDEADLRPVREAQAMARLSHANVVTVYEVLRLGGRTAIVMALIDGEDLRAWRERTHPDWPEIALAYAQAGRGLAAAHRAGLVHRDFKPQNALIDRNGVVRVTDFGLARAGAPEVGSVRGGGVASAAVAGEGATVTGAFIGTPAYMAPEQHLRGAVDARTDQWALACSLYEALHGDRPFAGASREDLRAAVIRGTVRPEPADTRVPRRMRAAIRRALSVDPGARFASVDAFVAELAQPRRAWRLATAAAAAAVLAAVSTVVAIRAPTSCTGLDTQLRAVWNRAAAAGLRARVVGSDVGLPATSVDRIIDGLDAYAASWTSARTEACVDGQKGVRSSDVIDGRMRCLDQRLVELTGVLEGLSDSTDAKLRFASDAVEQLHPILDCRDAHDTVPRPASAHARSEIAGAEDAVARAWAMQSLGQFEQALSLAEGAVATGERTGWTPLTAHALVLRGECQDRMRRYADALATYERAATVAARARELEVVVEALERAFLVRGDHLGHRAEALDARPYIELSLESAGQPPRARAMWLHFLAILSYDDPSLRDEAEADEREALALWQKVLPKGHVYLTDSLETLANIEAARERFDESKTLLEEVLRARIASRGPGDIAVADVLTNLGVLEIGRADPRAAVGYLERARATARAAGMPHTPSLFNLGVAELDLGRWRASAASFAAALEGVEKQGEGPESRDVAEASIFLGVVELALGDAERGRPMLLRGVDLARRSGSPSLPTAVAHAARLALREGDRAAAHALLIEARALPATDKPLTGLVAAELEESEGGCARARDGYLSAVGDATRGGQRAVESAGILELAACEIKLGDLAAAATRLEPEVAWLTEAGADDAALAPARAALARAQSTRRR